MDSTREILTDAVSVIDILQSMYCGENEFSFKSVNDEQLYARLQASVEEDAECNMASLPETIQCQLQLPLQAENMVLTLICHVYTKSTRFELLITSADNPWLSREAHQSLTQTIQTITTDAEDRASQILEAMQTMQSNAENFAVAALEQAEKSKTESTSDNTPGTFVRQWIWFPMIYTREKRGHIVDWAPRYSITGFLCPGKPGALCLEGTEKNVARFINDIKTISWADIPAGHRKMTLKWQERQDYTSLDEMNTFRRFPDMTEVTFELHGAFGNHNSLSALQRWMQERGCGEAFEHLFEYES